MVDEEALRAFYEEASQAQNAGQANPNPFKKPACIFCKKRKIKCDFQMPCFQCCKRGHECSYEEPKKKWTATVKATPSQLAAKVDQLTAELELQKHMAQYWQKQYHQKSQVKDYTPVPIQNKRPMFSGSAAELCLNVGAAVLKVSQAFSDLMGAMMPYSTSNFSPELSALFWNRLVTNSPEDLVATTKCMNADSIAQLLIHSSIFALGSALIQERQLANHFFSTANILLSMTPIRNVRTTDADLVNRVLQSFIFCMYYHMINGTFSSILPLWRRAAELFLFNEQILNEDRTSCEEIACMMALLEPEEASKTDVWAKRLESATSRSAYMPITNLWKNIARVAIVLPKLAHFVPAHSQYLQQFWEDLQLESLLEQVRDSPHYNFYGIWVYNMKGISAVNRSMHDYAGAEMNQSIRIVDQLSKQISNTSQQIYITRSLEHIHYFVTKMQERAPDSCALELMLDQIEAMMAGEENSSSDDSSYYGNNNNTNQMYDIYHPISSDYLSYDTSMASMVV